jgi:hypothetical protein
MPPAQERYVKAYFRFYLPTAPHLYSPFLDIEHLEAEGSF